MAKINKNYSTKIPKEDGFYFCHEFPGDPVLEGFNAWQLKHHDGSTFIKTGNQWFKIEENDQSFWYQIPIEVPDKYEL